MAVGYPTETTSVITTAWQVDIGMDTGVEWPDGTEFTVHISMSGGWEGELTNVVSGTVTYAGDVILYPPISPLSVDAGGLYNGVINQGVYFSGSASGGVQPYTSWYWDFGDGNFINSRNPVHIYSEIGTYIVSLTVEDSDNHTSTAYANAIISEGNIPIANSNGPYFGKVGQDIQFHGDAIGGNLPYLWLWNFGDGTKSNLQNPVHKFDGEGEYIISLTVKDVDDKSDTSITSCSISENNPPNKPVISGPTSGKPDTSYRYTFNATDPNNDEIYYYVEWTDRNWGDWIGPINSGEELAVWYKFSEEGTFKVRCKAKDVDGDESDWSELEVTMPINKSINIINNWILRMIQRFPILEFLL